MIARFFLAIHRIKILFTEVKGLEEEPVWRKETKVRFEHVNMEQSHLRSDAKERSIETGTQCSV